MNEKYEYNIRSIISYRLNNIYHHIMIKLRNLLNESPAQPAPARPERAPQPDVMPGAPKIKPEPRRRSTPNPSTSPTPSPKAQTKTKEKGHQAPKDGPKPGPVGEGIMDKIVARYKSEFNKLHEVDYEKIFDPETVGKLKGSVTQRMQGKNPMQSMQTMMQLAPQIARIERGYEDVLSDLAKSVVYEAYPYLKSNQDIIEIDAQIVSQGQVQDALQPDSPNEEDIEDLDDTEKEDIMGDMKKRRIINSITAGGAIGSKTAHYLQQEYLDVIGDNLSDKYRDINQASLDMIDFVVSQGKQNAQRMGGSKESSVGAESVFWDFEKEKWIIKARAVNFAVLIHEITKGMYEIISLFGFNNLDRGEKVVGKVDKLSNEPEDLAYGQMISKNLFDLINKLESNVTSDERDDFLQDVYKLPNEEFIKLITNVINNRVDTNQTNQLKGMFSQMRQDKTADDADNSLFERLQRMAGIR